MSLRTVLLCCFIAVLPLADALARVHTEERFAAGLIDKSLLKHANAVMREHELEINIPALDEVDTKEHYVLTILNDKGLEYARISESFSKLKKIKNISAAAYDKDGAELFTVKDAAFRNNSEYPQGGWYSDNKIRSYEFDKRPYPFTIEVTIECTQNFSFYIPGWMPQPGDDCAVEQGTLSVTAPATMELRYKELHTDKAEITTTGENKSYKWHVANIPATEEEPMSYEDRLSRTGVLLAPTKFRMEDYEGNMQSWKEYGKFLYELNKGRDILPAEEQKKIQALVSNAHSDKEKISILYKYMQDNFRYVAIEYGISGWQTLDATFLAGNKYGDCKALSNYMMSMLEVAGITSYPVIIYAGRENEYKVLEDFPSTQFNHVILCVPQKSDTTWLECTSSDLSAGYLSDFTHNRYGLMVTPEGGVLVHTPVYGTAVNKEMHHATAVINAEGNMQIEMANTYTGMPAEKVFAHINHVSEHELSQYINEKFSLPGYEVQKSDFKRADEGNVMGMYEQLSVMATNMVSSSNGRTVIDADLVPVRITAPVLPDERKTPFYIPTSYAMADTFTVTIAAGSEVEYMPAAVSEQFPFGTYQYKISKTGDKIEVLRSMNLYSGIYPADIYSKFEKFADLAGREGRMKVVLKNK